MRARLVLPVLMTAPLLTGCLGTVVDVVTLPVKAAGSAVFVYVPAI